MKTDTRGEGSLEAEMRENGRREIQDGSTLKRSFSLPSNCCLLLFSDISQDPHVVLTAHHNNQYDAGDEDAFCLRSPDES